MNYSRNDLTELEAISNQMRNAVYHLMRFMKVNNIGSEEIKSKLRRMGANIAKTFINHWKPVNKVDSENLKDFIATVYKKILNSSIMIEIREEEKMIKVTDKNCALCKYHYEDIEVAGCEIVLGFVSEIIDQINKESIYKDIIYLEPIEVLESMTYGDNSCIHIFKFQIGGTK